VKDKKGAMALEIVIGIFTFIIVLCFLVDLLMLSWKFAVISSTNSYVARTAGIQGGILATAPDGFPGGNTAYISTNEMRNKLNDNFKSAGIESGKYSVKVNGKTVSSGASTGEVDYRQPVTTEINVTYKWDLMSNFVPGDLTQTMTSTRSSMSEFKYRYDTWVGE